MNRSEYPRVVIVGAGFAGLWAARALAKKRVEVTIVDQNNFHAFLPLLYQVSAAEIEPEEIAYPVRSILRKVPNISFDLARVERIDLKNNRLICEDHTMAFDYLILATGSQSNFFNIPGARDHAFPLKTMDEGITLRNHILSRFEHHIHECDRQCREARLTFVIVGGGATGVEFAGALAELFQGPLKKDFPKIDFSAVKIIQLEARDRLLLMMPPSLQTYTYRRLQKKGIDIRLNTVVAEITSRGVGLKDGTFIPTETVVWTAGISGNPLSKMGGIPLTGNGQVRVLPSLQVEGYPRIYVAGDLAQMASAQSPLPQVAPVAVQQGIWAAKNILKQIEGKPLQPFGFRSRGTMVTIGRNSGVAQIGRLRVTSFPAWLLWVMVHLMKLVGFRNRLLVLINWIWDYLFFERSVRLILPGQHQQSSKSSLEAGRKPPG